MNNITIIGRVNRGEPETRTTPQGHTVCNFEVVVDREKGRDWFKVAAWGKVAERVQLHNLKEGDLVAVCGSMQNRRFKDKTDAWRDSWQVEANQVTPLTSNYQGEGGPAPDRADERDGVPF